jgi:hypothetical protein
MPKRRPAAPADVVEVVDMHRALEIFVARYQAIPAADRAADLHRQHHLREQFAAADHVACHS